MFYSTVKIKLWTMLLFSISRVASVTVAAMVATMACDRALPAARPSMLTSGTAPNPTRPLCSWLNMMMALPTDAFRTASSVVTAARLNPTRNSEKTLTASSMLRTSVKILLMVNRYLKCS